MKWRNFLRENSLPVYTNLFSEYIYMARAWSWQKYCHANISNTKFLQIMVSGSNTVIWNWALPWWLWGVSEVGGAPGYESGRNSETWCCLAWTWQGWSASECPSRAPVSYRAAAEWREDNLSYGMENWSCLLEIPWSQDYRWAWRLAPGGCVEDRGASKDQRHSPHTNKATPKMHSQQYFS